MPVLIDHERAPALLLALGVASFAHACFVLAAIGQLRAAPLVALTGLAAFVAWKCRRALALPREVVGGMAIGGVLLLPLALFPPVAFDETLYHLPFVRGLARAGSLAVFPELRFPVFPQLHELLCVPPYLLAGDVATHLVSVVEVLLTAALLVEWGRRHHVRAGWLAAAIFIGSPFVVQLATILYVDAALMLFVTAGFYALDRQRHALAGFLLGTACGVKYLGGYFVIAALVIVIARRRGILAFGGACAAAALPTTAWIFLQSGNPVFPFFGSTVWALPFPPPVAWTERIAGMVRVVWDVTFARERMNTQPPITPFLIPAVVLILVAAVRDVRARALIVVGAVYLTIFSFLPQDSRYLASLLPLVSVAAAVLVATRWPRAATALAWLAVLPGIAYVIYRLALQGLPPATHAEREAWLARRVPEYRAVVRAGSERVYVCGGEQLKSYAAGELLGDFVGPYAYDRILTGAASTADLAPRLMRIDVRYLLVAKRVCAPLHANGGMELVYEDAHAQLWRVPELRR